MKSAAASNRRERYKTGGGAPKIKELSDTQEKILATIPNESIQGISGGFDTFDYRIEKGEPYILNLNIF